MTTLTQRFPRQEGDGISHQQWEVDLAAAHRVGRWSGRTPHRLTREVTEMAEHFPRWILTVGAGRQRVTCSACGGMLVFDRGLRCVACQRPYKPRKLPAQTSLAWFGLLPPVGIDGLTRLRQGLIAAPPAQHLVGRRDGIGHYLLVPLLAYCARGFPASPVRVVYLPAFFKIRGMPADKPAHGYHMLGDGTMCLFAEGQWRRNMTCREVLQQRAYPHVIKLLNYADGKRDAFAIVS